MKTRTQLEPPIDQRALVRAAAFQLLLGHFEPIGVEALAAETGITPERLNQLLQELDSYRRHTVLLAERQGSLSRS